MSRLIYIVIIVAICGTHRTFAQVKKNTVYAEIFGNGRVYSVNYDRIITISEKMKFAPRIGFSYMGGIKLNVPLEANVLFSKSASSKHFLEFGVGTTFRSPKYYEPGIRFFDADDKDYEEGIRNEYTARIGYRHQKPEGGWMYRAGILAIYRPYRTKNKVFFPMPALSVGYAF